MIKKEELPSDFKQFKEGTGTYYGKEGVRESYWEASPGQYFSLSADETERNQQKTIIEAFRSFGYTPSELEIDALTPTAGGKSGGGAERGKSAVSSYVTAVKMNQELAANDPTKQVLADEKGFFNTTQMRAAGYEAEANKAYEQLQQSFKEAPQLFGNLKPEQVDKFLAPLKRQYEQSQAGLQTLAARRGLAGSSTELQTLSDQQRQYKENVLAQGLNVGMQEQAARRQSLAQQQQLQGGYAQNQYGLQAGSLGRQAGIAQYQQEGATARAMYQQQLPLYLQGLMGSQAAASEAAAAAKQKSRGGLGGLLGTGGGALVGGLLGGPAGAMIGGQIGGGIGTGIETGSYAPITSGLQGGLSALPYMRASSPTPTPDFSTSLQPSAGAYTGNRLSLYENPVGYFRAS